MSGGNRHTRPLALLLAVGLALASSCARRGGPSWERLATRFRPADVHRAADAALFVTPWGRPLSVEPAPGGGSWLTLALAREDWVLQTPPTLWRAHAGFEPNGRPAEGEPVRLTEGERELPYQPWSSLLPTKRLEDGHFQLVQGDLLLRAEPGGEPPAQAVLRVFAGRGAEASGAWHLRGRRFSGDGLVVWPGERWETTVDLPAGAALRLQAVAEPLFVTRDPGGEGHRTGRVSFRVTLDGRELLQQAFEDFEEPQARRLSVPLGAKAERGARLAFEVDGAPAYTAFLAPVIGPAEPGGYGARPWDEARPDLVVFLADTFRADNLSVYGGTAGVTPHLDELARSSLVLRRAWSVGTYTLPAHASLFSGVFPRQAGILGTSRALPDELQTIAELLAAHGYRTGAVTDSVIVSSRFAMDQGFEWFDERTDSTADSLASTRERVRSFLDADDGRPVFLFVHSYRSHLPYRVSPESLAANGARLGIEGDFATLHAQQEELDRERGDGPGERARRAAVARGLRAHYLGGVADVDAGFEALRSDLEARGLLASGVLVFTSDHGEAFGEHGRVFHTGPVWEEECRIPLLLSGRGILPGVRDEPVSLIDLPPTLAQLAGLEPPAGWGGRSLLAFDADRPVFVFECKKSDRSTLAIVEGEHKVIGFEDAGRLARGELLGAFDLASDPGERHDLSRSGADWPHALLAHDEEEAARLLAPVVGPRAADLDEEKLQQLRAVGYGGD